MPKPLSFSAMLYSWLLFTLWTSPIFAEFSISTQDGLSLRFDKNSGIVAVAVDGMSLPADSIKGGFYISEVSGQSAELLSNISLEQDTDHDGVPDGFRSGGVWKRDNMVARSGQWSMKAEIPDKKDGMSGSFGIVAPVQGGATYLASFWLKCRDRGGRYPSSIGYMQQQNEKGERTTRTFQQIMSGGVTGTTDWRKVWMLLTTEGDTRKLYFRTDIFHGYGTLWIDDFSLKKIGNRATRIPTRAEPVPGGVRLTGSKGDLRIEATWKRNDRALRLYGKVVSEANRDRCVTLSYRLPIAAVGGRWWNDVGTSKPIQPGGRYSTTASFGSFGPYSVYPFSSVVPRGGSVGISLGVPLSPPRPFRLVYAADEGLAIEWDFGLSSLPELFPRSADFYAVLYRHDPDWGFRSAAKRYYDLYPDYFKVRVKRFGNWYYCDLNNLPNPEDFGLAYNEKTTRSSIAADHKFGTINFAYTEPWGWWGWALGLKPAENAPKPSYEEMIRILNERAGDKALLAKPGMNRAKVAHTILNSGVYDQEGKLRLTRKYVARWGGYNWCLNASPYAVEPGKLSRFQATYDWEIEPKLALGVDGIYLDSIVNTWSAIANYRRNHLAKTRHPLTFSRLNPKPAQLGVWHHYEFVKHLSQDLHSRGKLLMANIFPYNWVFFNAWLDVMGHEVWGADSVGKMRVERTLAYHKPYTWLMQQGEAGTAKDRERWMQLAMLYGIAPNVVGGTSDVARYEKWRPLYKKYMPTIVALAEAGWEPVTYASVQPAGVLLERFGPKKGRLYFTARNDTAKPLRFEVSVDWKALNLRVPETIMRLPDGIKLTVKQNRFTDTLQPGITRAYRAEL